MHVYASARRSVHSGHTSKENEYAQCGRIQACMPRRSLIRTGSPLQVLKSLSHDGQGDKYDARNSAISRETSLGPWGL
eukprot:8843426-Alexandrium_andersonii.AAC.1